MRLFNPTPQMIPCKCYGVNYFLNPYQNRDLTPETGNWILERFGHYGIVDITIKEFDKKKVAHFIAQKSMEGLTTYIEHLNSLLESYMNFDTEMKSVNQFGTVLKHRNVRDITELLESATIMLKELEDKYKVSIKRANVEERTKSLKTKIETLIEEMESDADNERKSKEEESKLSAILDDLIPKNIPKSGLPISI